MNGVKLYQTPEVFLPSDVRGYYFCPPGIFLFKDFIPFLLKGKVRICLSQLDGAQILTFMRRFKFLCVGGIIRLPGRIPRFSKNILNSMTTQ